jgi:hypothetical protein
MTVGEKEMGIRVCSYKDSKVGGGLMYSVGTDLKRYIFKSAEGTSLATMRANTTNF